MMIKLLQDYIKKHALFDPRKDKLLLGVSGGLDSVVLLDLLAQLQSNLMILHCNFNLRGEESDQDEEFVTELANKYHYPILSKSFSTSAFADDNQVSIEMAARTLRYDWFNKILKEKKFNFIALAHHLDDTFETVLFNLTKGTGIAGLRGIKPKRDKVVRPLLFADREMIGQYAKNHRLSWRIDSSNLSDMYIRNKIRHRILPVMKEINPNVVQTFQANLVRIGAVEEIFQQHLRKHKKKYVRKENQTTFIAKKGLEVSHSEVILAEMLKKYQFNYVQAIDIVSKALGQPGKKFYSPTHELVIDRKDLIITPLADSEEEYLITDTKSVVQTKSFLLKCYKADVDSYKISSNPEIAAFDLDLLQFPLKLRPWEPGDRFMPFGMQGQKKVSDFMIDHKIPLNLKDKILLLVSQKQIIWVVGYRIDERFKITHSTKNILEISIHHDQSI